MSPIKGIAGSPNNLHGLDKNKKTKKNETVQNKNSGSVKNRPQTGLSGKDSVNISNVARELLNNPISVETLSSEIDSIKTLDRATLREIHNKVESNFYDKPEVLEKIVDSMIPEAHSPEEVEATAKPQEKNPLQQIQDNIENGKYDSEEVLNTIVDRMLNPDNILS